jgi:hypothetical protein
VLPWLLRVCRWRVYGSAALVKVVRPVALASTLTMLASPETAALRKTRSESLSLTAGEKSKGVQQHERRAHPLGETRDGGPLFLF